MRHALTTRFVIVAAVVMLAASVLFATLANVVDEDAAPDRTDEILGLDADIERGRDIYTDVAQPACASCHVLVEAGITEADGGPSLDDLEPSAEVTIRSIVGGTVPAHDEQGYQHTLSNQQIADLADYLEEAAGN